MSDNFISAKECGSLLDAIKAETLQKAGIGSRKELVIKENVRGDYIRWIEEGENIYQAAYLSRLAEVIKAFNERFFFNIRQSEHHVTHYPPGARYERHVDVFKNDNKRIVSSVLYLNENWKEENGGEIVLYPENKNPVKIEPLAGRLVLFESTLPHEVLINHKDRYSITGWFKQH